MNKAVPLRMRHLQECFVCLVALGAASCAFNSKRVFVQDAVRVGWWFNRSHSTMDESTFLAGIKSDLARGGKLKPGGTGRWSSRPELHEAAGNGYIRTAAFLIANGANVSAVDREGETALHVAARNGHTNIMDLLLANGADVNVKVIDASFDAFFDWIHGGRTALHCAVAYRKSEAVRYLLSKHANVNIAGRNGLTALHLASVSGQKDMVDTLLANEANINAKTGKGETALHLAILSGRLEMASHLVKEGAAKGAFIHAGIGEIQQIKDTLPPPGFVSARDGRRRTPLHYAVITRKNRTVSFLIETGADVRAEDDEGSTPLFEAASRDYDDVVTQLVDANAETNSPGFGPLHAAASMGHLRTVEILLAHGWDVNASDRSGMTPLHYAAYWDRPSILTILLNARRVEVDRRDNYTMTPLHWATKGTNSFIVRSLLKKGANPLAEERDGWTPLRYAEANGHSNVIAAIREAMKDH